MVLSIRKRHSRRLSRRFEIIRDVVWSLRPWWRSASPTVSLACSTRLPLLLRHILRAQWPLTIFRIIIVTPIVQIARGLSRRRYSRESLRVRKPHARIRPWSVSLLLRCSSSLRRAHMALLWSAVSLIIVLRDAVVVVLLASRAVL